MPQSKPRDTFQQVALGHKGELYATALRYARNHGDAEDLVQETLLRAFSAWDRFREGSNCRAWLFRILTNSFINEYRRVVKERRLAGRRDEEAVYCPVRRAAARDPEGTLLARTLGDEVLEALESLPEEFRRVVLLADVDGLSYRDVADRLGCPLGTVMSRLHRGRRLLEATLGDYARSEGILRADEIPVAA
ncbi:MAG: sigma-70 family RNA polymerase sigma factor [Deltaproteobacteria bacterium]|nr:sigma-70 family RNA polymerase sigma factor [Deltaproteobacteria bacterium]